MSLRSVRCISSAALLWACGCSSLWDPFLAERSGDTQTNPDAGTPTPTPITGVCPSQRICWQNPLPQGNRLNAVHAISPTDVWAVGDVGTVLHFKDGAWTQAPSQTTTDLNAVKASSAQDIWGVGMGGKILHIAPPNTDLRTLPGIGDLYAVAALSPQQAFAAGSQNSALKWDGTQWLQTGPGAPTIYRGLTVLDANNIWLTAQTGTIWQWHGQPDVAEATEGMGELYGLWGSRPDNLWAVGEKGRLLRRKPGDMVPWKLVPPPIASNLYGIWGTGEQDLWAVGMAGTIVRIDSRSNMAVQEKCDTTSTLLGVSGTNNSDVWAVGDNGTILHRSQAGWTNLLQGTTRNVYAGWAASPSDAWAVGSDGLIMHWDGTSWTTTPSNTYADLRAISGSAPNDIWAVGVNGTVLHWDGTSWSPRAISGTSSLHGVYTPSASDTWIVGDGGKTYRYVPANSGWQVDMNAGGALFAISGTGPSDIWAVGQTGTALHYNGAAWVAVLTSTTQDLYALWASAANDVWFVGANGTALRWDGFMVRNASTGLSGTLRAIWGADAMNIFAAGDAGRLFQFNGTAWGPFASGTNRTLHALVAPPRGATAASSFWIFGERGTILQVKL